MVQVYQSMTLLHSLWCYKSNLSSGKAMYYGNREGPFSPLQSISNWCFAHPIHSPNTIPYPVLHSGFDRKACFVACSNALLCGSMTCLAEHMVCWTSVQHPYSWSGSGRLLVPVLSIIMCVPLCHILWLEVVLCSVTFWWRSCPAHSLTQTHPTLTCIHLVDLLLLQWWEWLLLSFKL